MEFKLEVRQQLELLLMIPAENILSGGLAFRENSWLALWWRHFGEGNRTCLVTFRNSGSLFWGDVAALSAGIGGGRVPATMGDGETCTDCVFVLLRPAESEQAGEVIGNYLTKIAGNFLSGWDLIAIDRMVEGDLGVTGFARSLKEE